MQQKRNSSVGEQSLEHGRRGLSFADKYFLLQGENQKLRRHIGKFWEPLRDWREQGIHFQAERDHYREQAREAENGTL